MTDIAWNAHSPRPAYKSCFRALRHSVSPVAIRNTAKPVALLAGGSVLILGLIAQLSTFALATDYTTTQTQSLQIGDTITTTGTGAAGYGMLLQNGATLTAPGDNVITTSGNNASGIVISSNQPATITATGTKIITTGTSAMGIYSQGGLGTVILNGVTIEAQGAASDGISISTTARVVNNLTADDKTSITATRNGINADGNIALTGTHVTSTGDGGSAVWFTNQDTSTFTQIIQGNAVIKTLGNQSKGVWSGSSSTQVPVVDDGVSVETLGIGSYGVGANGSPTVNLQVNAATVVTRGNNSDGARAMYQASTSLNGTQVTTHGANAAGAAVGNGPAGPGDINDTITMTGATLTTTGAGSNAVQIFGATNTIKMDADTTLATTGAGSHAISLQGGATKTYDFISPADDTLSTHISVLGDGSAAFNAQSDGVLIIKNLVFNGITLGANSWGAIAENGGTIDFESMGGDIKSLWARGSDAGNIGTMVLGGDSIGTENTRVRVDANGILDIAAINDKVGFTLASLEGNGGWVILDNTNLTLGGTANTSYAGVFEGAGSLIRGGTGTLTLTGDNSAYTAAVSVTGGGLYVDGKIGGNATVTAGALGGSGSIGGDVAIGAGGSLVGRQGQVLTVQGNLTLDAASHTTVTLGAPELPGAGGLFHVAGDLTLGGTLDITDRGGFAPGIYRIIDYDGGLTDNHMVVGQVPDGTDAAQMSIQVATPNQVNLINMSGADLNFWDGGNVANHGNNAIDGGNGTWNMNAANTNWADKDGALHGGWSDGQYAVFTGTAGTVTVDNSHGDIVVDGMQFAVDGYHVQGDAITLQDGEAIISVGNGRSSGAAISATIGSELKGNGSLSKMDYGTLILTADNSYTGGTTIKEGTLQLGNGGTAGSVKGDILNNGTLAVNRSDAYTLSVSAQFSAPFSEI